MEDNYYYVIEDKNINKYLVNFEEEELEKLRKEIIDSCSNVVHVAYRAVDEPDYFDDEHIRRYVSHKLEPMSYSSFWFGGSVGVFVKYDYYEYSKLVLILDNLLKGNMKSLDDLFNFSSIYGLKLEELKSKIERTKLVTDDENEKLDALVDSYVFEIKTDRSDLEKLEYIYIDKVKKSINLSLVDSISVEMFDCVRGFFEDSSINKNVSSGLKRVLKVRYK